MKTGRYKVGGRQRKWIEEGSERKRERGGKVNENGGERRKSEREGKKREKEVRPTRTEE